MGSVLKWTDLKILPSGVAVGHCPSGYRHGSWIGVMVLFRRVFGVCHQKY